MFVIMWKVKHVVIAPRAVTFGIIAAGFAVCVGFNYPGQLSYDSVAQLHDGRLGVYNSWHPPVMAFLLGLFDAVAPGTGLFVLFDALLFFGSLVLVIWMSPKVSWWTVAILAICATLPQVLLYQGIVWKDVLFADAATAGFVCIAFAAARWQWPVHRYIALSAGAVLLVLAALTRQNGIIALVLGLIAIAVATAKRSSSLRAPGKTALLIGGATTIAAVVLLVAANYALSLRAPGESGPLAQIKLLQLYDIIGIAKDRPDVALDILKQANPDLDELVRTDGARLYTPERNDTLVQSQDLQDEFNDTPSHVLAAQWRALIASHPLAYLKARASVFAWVFLTPELARCYPVFVGVDGPPSYMRDLGLTHRVRPQDAWLKSYGAFFARTPFFSHLLFALLGAIELVLLLRRGSPADMAMALLLVSALAFTASFFVISLACDYRYLLFLDLSALTAGVYLSASRANSA